MFVAVLSEKFHVDSSALLGPLAPFRIIIDLTRLNPALAKPCEQRPRGIVEIC